MLPSSAVTGSTGSECVIGQRSSATASSTALFVPLKLLRRTVLGGVARTLTRLRVQYVRLLGPDLPGRRN